MPIARQPKPSPPDAVIFDMDGVLIDSNPYHLAKWAEFLGERGVPFDPEKLPDQILGQRNDAALRLFFGPNLTSEQRHALSEDIEARFRASFEPHARPLPGLLTLIRECHAAGIPMAVASSAMKKNVDFVVEALGLAPYFEVLLNGDEVSRPKPDPEIYLRAAEHLKVSPSRAVAFEDSPVGIEAVVRAGIQCVAIASTFPFESLRDETGANCVVRSFEEMNLEGLRRLFDL
ncbi:MAG TPA: HAD family phosphatase [Terriglobia bacterium]|nr:HAD family phosphatase [Terriglobia bacterium]